VASIGAAIAPAPAATAALLSKLRRRGVFGLVKSVSSCDESSAHYHFPKLKHVNRGFLPIKTLI
jgi:hypothetical protein